jgi:hypothetical protein
MPEGANLEFRELTTDKPGVQESPKIVRPTAYGTPDVAKPAGLGWAEAGSLTARCGSE